MQKQCLCSIIRLASSAYHWLVCDWGCHALRASSSSSSASLWKVSPINDWWGAEMMIWWSCTGICIRISQFFVPSEAERNGSAGLDCSYELEGREKFYSLKWYRDEREFFRLYGKPPKNSPKRQFFPLPGIHVDVWWLLKPTPLQSFPP